MSWARRGATVTGVDFSEEAIKAARALADETGIDATFVQSDLYELPQNLKGQFDIVFTSHGVLGWLPDIEGWARVVAHFLKPGGIFYIVEVHPFVLMFDERRDDKELRLRYPYFHRSAPPGARGARDLRRCTRGRSFLLLDSQPVGHLRLAGPLGTLAGVIR